jgi:alkanesulfonate monooxygenase SsuD/methylene tetrahydromethanopterin reductase-like flavin-dependent oxidoreductase (luciferase family)
MLSIGIPGSTDAAIVRRISPLIEAAGYATLWVNDTPDGDALTTLAVAAEVTSTLRLATGVIPLDRLSAAQILERVLDLPADRLTLGVGSGGARHGLDLIERSVAELRDAGIPLVVGALGPRTRALAARIADGILFNWLSPAAAGEAMADLRRDAGGRAVRGILYARTIAEPAARPALEAEAARYGGYPSYAANFARLGVAPLATTIDLAEPDAVHRYAAVDELVLRVVTATGAGDELVRVIEAAVTDPGPTRSS